MERKIVEQLILKKSFNTIACELKVCKKTVRKIYVKAKDCGFLDGLKLPVFPAPLFPEEIVPNITSSEADQELLPHKDWIIERKQAGWHWVTVWEELPIKVGRSSFFRFLKRHGLNQKHEGDYGRMRKVVQEIISAPGESLLLDWGKLMDIVDENGKKKTVWAFAGVLGHSRYMMVRLVFSNSVSETVAALESMFRELGGVPLKLTTDNPKCFAIEASYYEAKLNVAFERFASFYQFIPECLPPREPKKKGKIERLIPYIRRIFEGYGEWMGMENAQEYMNKKVHLANQRKHGSTRLRPIDELIGGELSVLQKLPATSFSIEEYHFGKVRSYGHVRFRGKYYSLDAAHIKKEVFVIGNQDNVSIYLDGVLVETHQRIKSPYQMKSTKIHHLKIEERIIKDNEHYLERARRLGGYTEELVRQLLIYGKGFVDTRKVWGILNLDKQFSPSEIDQAARWCLDREELSYRSMLNFLNLKKSNDKILSFKSTNKFIRNIGEYTNKYQGDRECQ